ncbi:MAG: hypothetical protein H0X38_00260 [Planctomycetes bacterium]|nr:hypothetical protein [Planctomycetota bacterium]
MGDPIYAPDMPARIEAARAELLALGRRIGRSDLPESFTSFTANLLSALDRNDLLIAHGPLEREHYAQALVESGRFSEVLDGFRDQLAAYGAALLATKGRADLLDGAYGESLALTAAVDAGRFAEFYPRHRGNVAAGYMLVPAGLSSEALRDYPDNPGICMSALLAQGRIDEAEKLVGDQYDRAQVLLARGRDDEVVATCFDDAEVLYRVALRFLLAGETAKGRQLVDRLSTQFIDFSSTSMHWATPFIAAFLERSAGRAKEAENLLDAQLARHRTTGAQCLWYVAAFITGRIDEAAFRKQPCLRQVEERLVFAQVLRHQWRHEYAAAAVCFRQVTALPWWKLDLGPHDQLFLQWCLKEAQQ